MKAINFSRYLFLILTCEFLLSSCSVSKQISRSAKETVLTNKALTNAHVGISIFDPSENKYLYNFQGDKYFVPASNTKIPTCYAAMKYLGDSLVGLKVGSESRNKFFILIQPSGDPTFLHPDFESQPVLDFLIQQSKTKRIGFIDTIWRDDRWGSGWSWNDYEEYYMAERSSMPLFGNVLNIKIVTPFNEGTQTNWNTKLTVSNNFFDSILNNNNYSKVNFLSGYKPVLKTWRLRRDIGTNDFEKVQSNSNFKSQIIPFVTYGSEIARLFLQDTLKLRMEKHFIADKPNFFTAGHLAFPISKWQNIYSQLTDSMLKPMMHRSDNFFAEQSLLMVSNQLLGFMNDSKIIDTILNTDLKDLPQKPRWADGSGLSRYNLFTPQDFVTILNKMKNEFGMDRIKVIFPTGGEGTISSYYKADSGYIYGKTGTLSGVVAFSGFMYTKKGKLLIFSTLVNNHQAAATDVRRAVERFLQGLRNKY